MNGPRASVVSHSLRVTKDSLSGELHVLNIRCHSLSVSVSALLEYRRKCASKQHTKSVLFVQHARKQHAKNITRQYRVEHTFALSTTRTKVCVVSKRLQHVKISSVCFN